MIDTNALLGFALTIISNFSEIVALPPGTAIRNTNDISVYRIGMFSELKPDEGMPCAYLGRSLGRLGNNQGAIDFLVHAADHFPQEPAIPYDLACYCCELGQLKAAQEWLKRAIEVSGSAELKMRALSDERLGPIWHDFDA